MTFCHLFDMIFVDGCEKAKNRKTGIIAYMAGKSIRKIQQRIAVLLIFFMVFSCTFSFIGMTQSQTIHTTGQLQKSYITVGRWLSNQFNISQTLVRKELTQLKFFQEPEKLKSEKKNIRLFCLILGCLPVMQLFFGSLRIPCFFSISDGLSSYSIVSYLHRSDGKKSPWKTYHLR